MRDSKMRAFVRAGAAAIAIAGAIACRGELGTGTLTASEESATGVPIRGHVGARVSQGKEGPLILVPDIEVWAHDVATGGNSARVVTNPEGYFQTPPLAAGAYRICVAGAGYTAACDPATVTVGGDMVVLEHPVAIAPVASAVWGTVELADGTTPCFWDQRAFRTLMVAKVELVEVTTGALAGGPVRGNSVGQYVVPTTAPPGSYKVVAGCEAAGATAVTALGTVPVQVDLVVGNRPPAIRGLSFANGGVGVRRADPGDTVEVAIDAGDPDGDALRYTWTDDTGRPRGFPDAATVSWPLPNAEAQSAIFVQVSDGRGGYAVWRRSLRTDDGTVVFSGRVVDRATGAPIERAEVAISGVAAPTGSDGSFEIVVPDSMRFVLNASKRGYALTSRTYQASNRGLEIPLDAAQVQPFDAATGGTLRFVTTRNKQDKPLVFDIRIDPDSFVDANGAPYGGPASMEYFPYDTSLPYPIPGDQAGEWGGAGVRLETSGSFHLTPRDKRGRPLQMASGRSADFAFDIEPGPRAGAPPTIPFFLYDEPSGIWKEHGTLTRTGDRYLGQVKHFTAFNADTTFTDSACLKVVIDPSVLFELSLPLYLSAAYRNPATGSFVHNDTAVTDISLPIGIIRMAPNQDFDLELRDSRHTLIRTIRLNSGPTVPPGPTVTADGIVNDPNFDACNGPVVIRLGDAPAVHPRFLVPAGAPDNSDAYRRVTEALPGQRKSTLAGWKAANGFPPTGLAPDEVRAYYFNDGDLKFGRDMHCRKDPATSKTACYVTNYGNVGTDDAVQALRDARLGRNPVATVCMEHDPGAAAGQNVQFWAYNNEDNYFAAPALDSEGPKTVPEMCQACHQGFFNPASGAAASGSVFLPFDLESFKYDAFGDPFAGPTAAARQTDFRRLNALVHDTFDASSEIAELVNRYWYPGGVASSGATFTQARAAGGYPFNTVPGLPDAPLYDDVVTPVCRTCHIARPRGGDWTEDTQMQPGRIGNRVCGPSVSPLSFSMPRAEVPFLRFWQRGLDDVLVRQLPLAACPNR